MWKEHEGRGCEVLYKCMFTGSRVYVLKTELFSKLSMQGIRGRERCFIFVSTGSRVIFLKRNNSLSCLCKEHWDFRDAL